MNYRELTRKLKELGCALDHHAKGSHEVWVNTKTKSKTTIPHWGSRDLKPGTISRILRDLIIQKEDFDKA